MTARERGEKAEHCRWFPQAANEMSSRHRKQEKSFLVKEKSMQQKTALKRNTKRERHTNRDGRRYVSLHSTRLTAQQEVDGAIRFSTAVIQV